MKQGEQCISHPAFAKQVLVPCSTRLTPLRSNTNDVCTDVELLMLTNVVGFPWILHYEVE